MTRWPVATRVAASPGQGWDKCTTTTSDWHVAYIQKFRISLSVSDTVAITDYYYYYYYYYYSEKSAARQVHCQ